MPTLAGVYAFTVTATAAGGCTGSHNYIIIIGQGCFGARPQSGGAPGRHTAARRTT